MKKFLFLLLLLGSLSVFAGNTTCRVYGSKNNTVATLEQTTASSNSYYDNRYIIGKILLTKTEPDNVEVIVEAWEGNNCVGTTVVTISAGQRSNSFKMDENNGIKPNKTYRLAIASATCQ